MDVATAAGGSMDAAPAVPQSASSRASAWITRLDRGLASVENSIILASYTVLILIVGVETLRRALTGAQEVWGPEIALYAFVWLSWFSMAKHGRYGTHLAFSEVRQRLPQNAQRALEVLDCALWLAIGVIIIVTSWGVVENQIRMKQTVFGTPIPLYAASLAVPIGWAFSMVRILQRGAMVLFAWDRLKSERRGFLNL